MIAVRMERYVTVFGLSHFLLRALTHVFAGEYVVYLLGDYPLLQQYIITAELCCEHTHLYVLAYPIDISPLELPSARPSSRCEITEGGVTC